jgi:hypothetical protein
LVVRSWLGIRKPSEDDYTRALLSFEGKRERSK